MQDYKKLKIWHLSKDLSIEIYRLTEDFPSHEQFGLTSQMRRCSISISSNIAEGCGRSSKKELLRFLDIAVGSVFELESQVIIADELGLIAEKRIEQINENIDEVKRKIISFINTVKK